MLIFYVIYLLCMNCLCVGGTCITGGQRTNCRSWLYPPSIMSKGLKSACHGWCLNLHPLSHLASTPFLTLLLIIIMFISIYSLGINPQSDVQLGNIFFYSVDYLFTQVSFFCSVELFNCTRHHLSVVGLIPWLSGILSRKSFCVHTSWNCPLKFPKSFRPYINIFMH